MGIFKLSLLSFGIAIGAYWQQAFLPYIALLLTVGIILGIYAVYTSLRQ